MTEDEQRRNERREDDRREDDRKKQEDRLLTALQHREIELLKDDVRKLRQKVETLDGDRNRALLWGVLTLGTAVVGMGMWIFNLIVGKVHP